MCCKKINIINNHTYGYNYNNLNYINLYIYVGKNLIIDEYGIQTSSVPYNMNIQLEQYTSFVCSIETNKNYGSVRPSVISNTLKCYDCYFNSTGGFGIMSVDNFEKIYVEICNKFGIETKSNNKYYCYTCGIPLQVNQLNCWACEKGI